MRVDVMGKIIDPSPGRPYTNLTTKKKAKQFSHRYRGYMGFKPINIFDYLSESHESVAN
jgi:hypothetical protein